MPHATDIKVLQDVATLLRETHALYESVLRHLRDDAKRDALCGVVAVRGALHLRLRDHLASLGHHCEGDIPDARNDALCLGIFRQLIQGDEAGALCDVTAWDRRLLDEVAGRVEAPGVSPSAADNLRFTVQILQATPAAFAGVAPPLALAS